MTDELVQKILEGRCIECDALLPDHDRHCPVHPHRSAMDKLVRVVETLQYHKDTADPELVKIQKELLANIRKQTQDKGTNTDV